MVVKLVSSILGLLFAAHVLLPAQAITCALDAPDSCCCSAPMPEPVSCCGEAPQSPADAGAHTCPCVIQLPDAPAQSSPALPPDLRAKDAGLVPYCPAVVPGYDIPVVSRFLPSGFADGPPPAPPLFILLCSLLR